MSFGICRYLDAETWTIAVLQEKYAYFRIKKRQAAGGNLSALLASHISGASGMTAASALSGFTFSFWLLAAAGVFLWIISPWINRLMHGVR